MNDRLIGRAIERREAVSRCVSAAATDIDAAAARIAAAVTADAILHVVGAGVTEADASHVRVEFLHPVIVGKRSVPTRVGAPPARPAALLLALRLDDDPAIGSTIDEAVARGHAVVDLTSGAASPRSDVASIALGPADQLVGRELLVTAYHVLWEMVHEHLDGAGPAALAPASALDDLYPMLPTSDHAVPGRGPQPHVLNSVASKAAEAAALRATVQRTHAAVLGDIAGRLRKAREHGATVHCIGNGGSSTDASAFARQLRAVGVRADALADDTATVTALANDVGFEVVFARMLRAVGRPGDVVIAFSTSGDSPNVIAALETARSLGMTTVGFAGGGGGRMAAVAPDHLVVVPSASVHRVQEAQTTAVHTVLELLED